MKISLILTIISVSTVATTYIVTNSETLRNIATALEGIQ